MKITPQWRYKSLPNCCGSCLHWTDTETNRCDKLSGDGSDLAATFPAADLIISPTFGCVLWEDGTTE